MLRSKGHSRREVWILLGVCVALVLVGFSLSGWLRPPQAASLRLSEHPRVFFSSQDIPRLRKQAQTTHREIWEPILAFARSQLDSVPPSPPAAGDLDGYRNAGNTVIPFAFAYVITGDQSYLELTRRYLLAYSRWRYWGDERILGDRDLGFHHMLMGSAIAYDWIYQGLSRADRAAIGASLGRRAQQSYEASSSAAYQRGNWWRRAYTQNHHWTNHSALGLAALVLEGRDLRAEGWLAQAIDNMARDRFLADGIADGTWHEGIPYQSYMLTMSLPFLDNLRRLHGQDLLPHSYLRSYVSWRLYNILPGSRRFAISHGDFDWSWGDAYGPAGLLRFAAREYGDRHAEWTALRIIDGGGRDATVFDVPWGVFEFLYYDPAVQPQSPDGLYPNRTFPDLEGVIWRTGWGDADLVFGLKTGAPGGRYAFDAFTNGKRPPFDPSSPIDLFHTGHDHEDANSFYLYRGGVDLASETAGYQVTGTEFHNSLLVDGRGQHRAVGNDSDPDAGPDALRGTDGGLGAVYGSRDFSFLVADAGQRYRRADSGGDEPGSSVLDRFRRHVLFVKPGYLVMVDDVRASSPHRYEWVSHFGESVSVDGDWVKGVAERDQVLGVKVVRPEGFAASIGGDGKPYVRIRPLSNVESTRFVTVLYPTDAPGWRDRPAIASLGEDDQLTGVRVSLNGTQDHLVKYGDMDEGALGDYSFDGQLASVIRDPAGHLQRIFLGQGSRLSDGGGSRVLIQSNGKIQALQVDYQGDRLRVYGDGLSGVAIYAPGVDISQVTINDEAVAAHRSGDYVLLR